MYSSFLGLEKFLINMSLLLDKDMVCSGLVKQAPYCYTERLDYKDAGWRLMQGAIREYVHLV
jgi:hypothetical protein